MVEGLRPVVSQSLTLRNRSGEIGMETWQKQLVVKKRRGYGASQKLRNGLFHTVS